MQHSLFRGTLFDPMVELPIKGEIGHPYLITSEMTVTNKDIEKVIDLKTHNPNKLQMQTMCLQVNMNLGSKETMRILECYENASVEILQIRTATLYVDIMYADYWKYILAMSMIYFVQFTLVAVYVGDGQKKAMLALTI